ncbi:type II toxin-antitoxin system RelE/ParE family toxin [Pantoea agglomerans]
MSQQFNVIIAPMAVQSLSDIESYKSGFIGTQRAMELVDFLLDDAIEAIEKDPTRYRFNFLLQNRGMLLRERLDVENEYRVLYDFDGKNIEILMFVSMKQDFEKQLYRYNLLH